MMLLKCTYAAKSTNRFEVGQIVSKSNVEKYYIFNGMFYPKNGSEFSVHGLRGRLIYRFEAARRKSLRKMLVRAFRKFGTAWDDSKNTAWSWGSSRFKNSNEWARYHADTYFKNDGTPDESMSLIEEIISMPHYTQHDIDSLVDEELSYW